jgi:hypothetical protein
MSLRCDSLYTFPKANPVPRWCWPVPTSESWCQVVLVGESWCQVVPVGGSQYRLVETGEIGNVGYNPCSSVQDCNNMDGWLVGIVA